MKKTQEFFSARIAELRNKMGLSQEEFGVRAGKSKGTIWTWETGKNEPHRKDKIALAKKFNVPNSYFTGNPEDDREGVADLQEDGVPKNWRELPVTRPDLPDPYSRRLREFDGEPNPFAVDKTDPEALDELAGAFTAVRDARKKIAGITIYLRDLDNSMLALENRLRATLGEDP